VTDTDRSQTNECGGDVPPFTDGHRTRTFEFRPTLEEVAVARRSVVAAVQEFGGATPQVMLDDLALATSEAVTNAIEHARTDVRVTVTRNGPTLRVAVHDNDDRPLPEPRIVGEQETSGRGLFLISALAECWGVDNILGDGKTLWFELTSDGPASRGGES
jgi:anti-sigma regulatory factor (Ser/Thr protein kinase)